MKTIKASILTILLTLEISIRADAAPFEITFDLGQGDTGSGQIEILQNTNGNFFAASGYLTISSGAAAGNWSLYSAGGATTYPGYFTSPAGAYWYNNAFYPDGVNPQYPGINAPLDNYGLLFTQGSNEFHFAFRDSVIFRASGSQSVFEQFN